MILALGCSCLHPWARQAQFIHEPSGFSVYLRGHALCWHPVPSGTHPASNHGIHIVLPERRGHDHGGRATPASESAVRVYPHLGQGPIYPNALLPKKQGDPTSATVRKYRAKGTCGTFAGKRPPTSTFPVALAAYGRAHQEHLNKSLPLRGNGNCKQHQGKRAIGTSSNPC